MPEFLRLTPPSEARLTFLKYIPLGVIKVEHIATQNALNRILASTIRAEHPLPEFPRSTVDGYAVCARDTYGVSDSSPGYLVLLGEIPMGEFPAVSLQPGTCLLIHTGGMLPENADAVIMLENTQPVNTVSDAGESKVEIEITQAVAEGENTIRVGEDVQTGSEVLEAGLRLRPAHIGGCMALGITKVQVVVKPKVGVISSGDEVIMPECKPRPGQVRDINSYSLAALIEDTGGTPVLYGIARDEPVSLKKMAEKALSECQVVIITAGSSASIRDKTEDVISRLGKPGVIIHGLNIRPGKPTILAVCNEKAVIGLPGNPVSALIIARLFLQPVIEKLLGLKKSGVVSALQASLTINIPSSAGREDWIPVKLISNHDGYPFSEESHYLAEPIFGKSNFIFDLASAEGLVRIPPDSNGLSTGDLVKVYIL